MLEFIFTDIWHFWGACLLLAILGDVVCDVIKAIKGK